MILKKKTQKKNPSNRKPISYSTEFRGRGGVRESVTYIQKDIHTDRPSDEAGPRGAFALKNWTAPFTLPWGKCSTTMALTLIKFLIYIYSAIQIWEPNS